MENYTITTIYFDGQFWVALIEKCLDGNFFTGRHIFGAEPSNPELLEWMLYGYHKIHFLPVQKPVKIRVKKEVKTEHSIKKSLDAFKDAQKAFQEEKKIQTRKILRINQKTAYLELKQKKKEKKRH